MGSINAEQVAKEVSETIRADKKVILGEIIKKNGYSESTSKSPTIVTKTKSYKKVIDPVIRELESLRSEAFQGMKLTKDKAKYRDFTDAAEKTTKMINLLGGKPTEIHEVTGLLPKNFLKIE